MSKKKQKLEEQFLEKYGKITQIVNVQLRNCRYDITADTEKEGRVYFSTGGGFDDYKYSPHSTSWSEQVYGGLTLDGFQESFDDSWNSVYNSYKSLEEIYGKITSINIEDHWKYVVSAEITVEKKDEPLLVTLSRDYDTYCEINTYDLSWCNLLENMSGGLVAYFYEYTFKQLKK